MPPRPRRRSAVRPSPIFLGCIGLTLLGAWLAWRDDRGGVRLADFGVFLMVVGAWVVSLCLHEFAHAYAAFRAGDRDVEAAGYLTLNPLKYAHPILSIVIPLLFIVQGGIGLPGGAVYLHRHSFRSKGMQSAAAAAGPFVNVVFGVALLLLVRGHHTAVLQAFAGHAGGHVRFWSGLAFLGFLQLTAAVLNLLPVPGLDGWAIIEPYVDPATARGAEAIKPWGLIGVIVLLQIRSLNAWFFDLVFRIYDRIDSPVLGGVRLADLGHAFFRFWAKPAA
jgi:Zn-dependent protease